MSQIGAKERSELKPKRNQQHTNSRTNRKPHEASSEVRNHSDQYSDQPLRQPEIPTMSSRLFAPKQLTSTPLKHLILIIPFSSLWGGVTRAPFRWLARR